MSRLNHLFIALLCGAGVILFLNDRSYFWATITFAFGGLNVIAMIESKK